MEKPPQAQGEAGPEAGSVCGPSIRPRVVDLARQDPPAVGALMDQDVLVLAEDLPAPVLNLLLAFAAIRRGENTRHVERTTRPIFEEALADMRRAQEADTE